MPGISGQEHLGYLRLAVPKVRQFGAHQVEFVVADQRFLDIEHARDRAALYQDIPSVEIHMQQPRCDRIVEKRTTSKETVSQQIDEVAKLRVLQGAQVALHDPIVHVTPSREWPGRSVVTG